MGAESSSLRRNSGNHKSKNSEDHQIDVPSTSTAVSQDSSVQTQNSVENNQSSKDAEIQQSKCTLVVVNDRKPAEKLHDPLTTRLSEINSFEPIMQEVENSFWSNRALREVRSRIKSYPMIKISNLYSERLKRHAENVAIEQGRLTQCVKEVDYSIVVIMKAITVRQKKFASHAEKFNSINDLCKKLSRCNMMLSECLTTADFLNELLPEDDRLEPFVF